MHFRRPGTMQLRLVMLLALFLVGRLQSQEVSVVVRDAGRGPAGVILRDILARPHRVIPPSDGGVRLRRDSVFASTVVVVGSDVAVEAKVTGDVLVVGGDLFLHPGAHITGRAIAVGGGVYNSTLATVQGGLVSFPDAEFAIVEVPGGYALSHREPEVVEDPASLPLLYGLRIPTYTRVEGLSLPWGPRFVIRGGDIVVEPSLTYRSDIGELDPYLSASMLIGRDLLLEAGGGRITATNDRWIQTDLTNSIATLVRGRDQRNYYRAQEARLSVRRAWQSLGGDFSLGIGARYERASSVNAGGPWSLFGRTDEQEGILRANPTILRGKTTSALALGSASWEKQGISASVDLTVESVFDAPENSRFTQTTLGALVTMPTFRNHRLEVKSHLVLTAGDTALPQRYSYLGGSATLPTFDLLVMGGDQLAFIESRYVIPIERIKLPFVGSPELILRHMIGSAGVGDLPPLEQNVGIRLRLKPLRLDFTIDPVSGHTDTGLGVSF